MFRNAFALGVAIALSGCAFASKTFGPDGRESYSIDCSGMINTWGECEKKAGSICGARGYDVVSRAGDRGQVVTANSSGAWGGSVISRSMLISCKG